VRSYIKDSFAEMIQHLYPEAEMIAGVATGAISHGALVADKLELPFIYVRSGAKEHGLGNQIEGYYQKGQKVVVVEDLISTGGSSLSAVRALREAGCNVLGMVAIFTYEFKKSADGFKEEKCALNTLCHYSVLIESAVEAGYISDSEVETLKNWRTDPANWGTK
jgi:orotate phosphoribosyltransferase